MAGSMRENCRRQPKAFAFGERLRTIRAHCGSARAARAWCAWLMGRPPDSQLPMDYATTGSRRFLRTGIRICGLAPRAGLAAGTALIFTITIWKRASHTDGCA